MALVKGVDRWEEGTPTPIPSGAKVRAHSGGESPDPLFTTVLGNVRVDPDQAHNFCYDGQDRRVSEASCLPRPNTRIAT